MADPRPNLAPRNRYPERARQQVDAITADPASNRRTGRRAGPMQAEEGVAWQGDVTGAFVGGVSAQHGIYEAQIGAQSNGRVEPGATNPPASWQHVPPAVLGSFAEAASGDQGQNAPPPWLPRDGANRSTITDLSALQAGERPRQVVVRTQAPPNGARRPNQADVTGV